MSSAADGDDTAAAIVRTPSRKRARRREEKRRTAAAAVADATDARPRSHINDAPSARAAHHNDDADGDALVRAPQRTRTLTSPAAAAVAALAGASPLPAAPLPAAAAPSTRPAITLPVPPAKRPRKKRTKNTAAVAAASAAAAAAAASQDDAASLHDSDEDEAQRQVRSVSLLPPLQLDPSAHTHAAPAMGAGPAMASGGAQSTPVVRPTRPLISAPSSVGAPRTPHLPPLAGPAGAWAHSPPRAPVRSPGSVASHASASEMARQELGRRSAAAAAPFDIHSIIQRCIQGGSGPVRMAPPGDVSSLSHAAGGQLHLLERSHTSPARRSGAKRGRRKRDDSSGDDSEGEAEEEESVGTDELRNTSLYLSNTQPPAASQGAAAAAAAVPPAAGVAAASAAAAAIGSALEDDPDPMLARHVSTPLVSNESEKARELVRIQPLRQYALKFRQAFQALLNYANTEEHSQPALEGAADAAAENASDAKERLDGLHAHARESGGMTMALAAATAVAAVAATDASAAATTARTVAAAASFAASHRELPLSANADPKVLEWVDRASGKRSNFDGEALVAGRIDVMLYRALRNFLQPIVQLLIVIKMQRQFLYRKQRKAEETSKRKQRGFNWPTAPARAAPPAAAASASAAAVSSRSSADASGSDSRDDVSDVDRGSGVAAADGSRSRPRSRSRANWRDPFGADRRATMDAVGCITDADVSTILGLLNLPSGLPFDDEEENEGEENKDGEEGEGEEEGSDSDESSSSDSSDEDDEAEEDETDAPSSAAAAAAVATAAAATGPNDDPSVAAANATREQRRAERRAALASSEPNLLALSRAGKRKRAELDGTVGAEEEEEGENAPRSARSASRPRVVWSAEQQARLRRAVHEDGVTHRQEHEAARESLAIELAAMAPHASDGAPVTESRVRYWLVNYAARLKKKQPALGKLLMRDMSERGNLRPDSGRKKVHSRPRAAQSQPKPMSKRRRVEILNEGGGGGGGDDDQEEEVDIPATFIRWEDLTDKQKAELESTGRVAALNQPKSSAQAGSHASHAESEEGQSDDEEEDDADNPDSASDSERRDRHRAAKKARRKAERKAERKAQRKLERKQAKKQKRKEEKKRRQQQEPGDMELDSD